MNDNDRLPGRGADADRAVNDPERLAEYESRTRDPLHLLALTTLWLVVVPWGNYGHGVKDSVLACRVALSVVYGIDLAIRSALAPRHVHYPLSHPIALASVLYPPVRVFFSIRLVRSMFRRGHLTRFLTAAAVLVLNGAIIVYLFERHAPGSNIHTVRDAVWWSFVTVTTVGYGDFYPVTTGGRVTACFIMGTGLLTLAVLTAQVASSFVAQAPRRARLAPQDEPARPEERLARIEQLLTAAHTGNSPGAIDSD